MISINLITPQEMAQAIAEKAKAKRLAQNFSQQTLARRSGVSYGSLKKFERTGQISLASLLKIALSLGALDAFTTLFAPTKPEEAISLDDLIKDTTRKRGRK